MSPLIFQAPRGRSSAGQGGFSLVEIAIALGIVAFSMLAILGLAQTGLLSLRESVNDSTTGLILHDIRAQLEGTPFPSDAELSSGALKPLPPLFYDGSGLLLTADTAGKVPGANYRVDVTLGATAAPLPNARVAVALVAIGWPVNPETGGLASGSRSRQLSFLVTPATDRGWTAASPTYQPKVGQ